MQLIDEMPSYKSRQKISVEKLFKSLDSNFILIIILSFKKFPIHICALISTYTGRKSGHSWNSRGSI